MRYGLWLAGLAASVALIVVGVSAVVAGLTGRSDIRDNLKQEQIVGSADMTPSEIKQGIKEAGLKVAAPDCSVAGEAVDDGDAAHCFAQYMRVHALEATGGKTYAQMGRFLTAAGKDTSDEQAAAKDPKTGRPVENAARNIWVTETALSTALNTAYFGERVASFAFIMGVALVLIGVGFLVFLVYGSRRDTLRPA